VTISDESLLANIALHGLEQLIEMEFPTDIAKRIKGSMKRLGRIVGKVNIIRYADDFVVLCEEITVVQISR
jgi:RNA-directed DNA polymerase